MIYVTADLHGMHPNAFQKLLDKAGFSDEDFLFILGDVIDRGEYGAQFLLWLTQQPNMALILGNHEANLLSCAFLFADVNDESLSALTMENMELVQNWLANGGYGFTTIWKKPAKRICNRHWKITFPPLAEFCKFWE